MEGTFQGGNSGARKRGAFITQYNMPKKVRSVSMLTEKPSINSYEKKKARHLQQGEGVREKIGCTLTNRSHGGPRRRGEMASIGKRGIRSRCTTTRTEKGNSVSRKKGYESREARGFRRGALE